MRAPGAALLLEDVAEEEDDMAAAVVVVGVGGVGVEDTTIVAARWAVPLASAPSRSNRLARVCGGTVGMVNVCSRAPACPPFNVALRERGPTAIHGRRPRSGRGSDRFPDPEIRRSHS